MGTSKDVSILENMKREFIDEGSNLASIKGYPEYHRECLDAAGHLEMVIRIYRKMEKRKMRPAQER